jgi:hypothetical protein
MKTKLIILLALVALQTYLNPAQARKGHHHDHDDGDTITTNNTTTNNSGGGSNNDVKTAGVAIAGAAGSCVRDWTQGIQYCASWAMVDGDDYDKAVHAFGGGVTTRVDQFALSFYGGIEDLDKDDKTYMLTGSINWR